MCRVTRRAVGCNDETLSQQPFAMDTFREICDDVILVNRPLLRNLCPLRVAFAAQERDLHWRDRRTPIFGRKNFMGTVTVIAARRQRVTPGDRLAVKRF